MQLSYQWLCQWTATGLDAAEAGEKLTLAGLELEGIEAAAPPLDGVVVGRIIEAAPHPDADRLQLCQVDAGAEPLAIVCGAPNARAGLTVAVATVGTRLPGGLKIKRSKIRGVESAGMLCSGGELGLADTDGILELPDDQTPGVPLTTALALDDQCLDIALTPNRGDCLSLRGVARELACISGSSWALPDPRDPTPVSLDETRSISLESLTDCSRYVGRVIRGLDRNAPTPTWMAERLRRSGLRSINPLVDVTNYVMLELGQPMHAFDLDRLQGDIHVRRARAGESLTLLNEQLIELSPEELVITDASGPIALAGAMGGLGTAVSDSTRDVFLESACFSPQAVAGTGRRFKLSSDSLHRFERGVDPCLQEAALERATALLVEIAGGQAGPLCAAAGDSWIAPRITLRPARLRRLLGADIDDPRIRAVLERLECRVEADGDSWQVETPSHRYDLAQEIDLVEEVARIVGYDALGARPRLVPATLQAAPRQGAADARATGVLCPRGYYEVLSYSFADPRWDSLLSAEPPESGIPVDNPMSPALGQMRRSLWGSLLPLWQHNAQRQQDRIRLFEVGREYRRNGTAISETDVIAGVASGPVWPEQWGAARRAIDFYDIKGDLLALLGQVGECVVFDPSAAHPALHPGQSAGLSLDGQVIGQIGRLHPGLKGSLQLPQAPWLFQLDLSVLSRNTLPVIQPLADTPSTRRDLALLVDQSLEADKLINHVRSSGLPGLQSVRIFDVFTGDALPKGFKSVALGLIFQDFSRTLTDREVDEAMKALASGLEREFGAQIRD